MSSPSFRWLKAPGAVETVSKGVQLSAIRDPEGNTITFIGDFRVQY